MVKSDRRDLILTKPNQTKYCRKAVRNLQRLCDLGMATAICLDQSSAKMFLFVEKVEMAAMRQKNIDLISLEMENRQAIIPT